MAIVPVLRPLEPADLDDLLEVQRLGAVTGLGHIFPQDRYPFPVESIRERWERELADPEVDCFAVVADGRVAGFAATRGDELLHFGTAVETWGSGLADAVHGEVLAHLRRRGHARAWLWCYVDNTRAVRFYLRLGWRASEVAEPSPYPPHALLRRYERDLLSPAQGVTVREARSDDVPGICLFGDDHIAAHYAPIIGPREAADQVRRWWNADVVATAVAARLVVVAEADGELVGVAQWGRHEAEHVVYKLYVHPARRGRGLGRQLLDAVEARLPAEAERLCIEHFAGNDRAGAFYEREGYAVERVEPSATGDPALAVVWRARRLPGA